MNVRLCAQFYKVSKFIMLIHRNKVNTEVTCQYCVNTIAMYKLHEIMSTKITHMIATLTYIHLHVQYYL